VTEQKSTPVVLVVDDEATMRRAMVRAVTRAGCRGVEAADAVEALGYFGADVAPDLVIADLHLEGESGLELAQQIGRAAPGTPVLIATGFERSGLTIEPPIVGILEKPFELDHLVAEVRRALQTRPRSSA
jgi:DNA-binding NtrC family response regulator